MKHNIINALAACAALLSPLLSSAAPPADGFWVEAQVIDVQPLLRVVQVTTPREVCWNEPVRQAARHGYRSHTPKVIGAILGGVVGNQFGDGSGRTAMTAAGALLGASVGRDVAYRRHAGRHGTVSMERHCEVEQTVHEEERIDGYRVTYEYGGKTFVTRTRVEPGTTIRVRVSVAPVTYNQRY